MSKHNRIERNNDAVEEKEELEQEIVDNTDKKEKSRVDEIRERLSLLYNKHESSANSLERGTIEGEIKALKIELAKLNNSGPKKEQKAVSNIDAPIISDHNENTIAFIKKQMQEQTQHRTFRIML